MHSVYTKVTDQMNFFEGNDPVRLAREYGTPLYVCNERILRERCRDLKNLVTYPNFVVDYSAKANGNLTFLKIVRSEGLEVDAVSPGEIFVEKAAGFRPEEIFYIGNNATPEEMQYAIDEGVTVSVDSVSQLKLFGRLNPGGKVAVRFNPGVGAGHHEKVVTAGKKTKFGVNPEFIPEVKEILAAYNLTLIGINQHIGSLFMTADAFVQSVDALIDIARQFPDLAFIDMGGGFGIPYHKEDGEAPLDMEDLGRQLDKKLFAFAEEYGKMVKFRIEPGRYVSAESCVLLGRVNSVKLNHDKKFAGCDIGFNVLVRPVMYDSYHGIEIYRPDDEGSDSCEASAAPEPVTIVGNICESGDILAKDRLLPPVKEGDILGVLDAGAYGFAMSSNYNNRLRPAEILIRENGEVVLTRKRECFEDLVKDFVEVEL